MKELTAREWQLTRYLAGHAGRPVMEIELRDHLFGGICHDSAVRLLIHRIRQKLGQAFIENHPAGGYYLSTQRVEELCPQCKRPVVRYEDELVCYACVGTAFVDLEVGRAPYQDGTQQGKPWTEEEEQFVLENEDRMSLEELAQALNRTPSGVRGLRASLGLPRKTYVRRER